VGKDEDVEDKVPDDNRYETPETLSPMRVIRVMRTKNIMKEGDTNSFVHFRY